MKKRYTEKDFVKEFRISYFFYKLFNSKPPKNLNENSIETYLWLLKFYTGLAYYNFHSLYLVILSYLTRYFPFSLFYKNTLVHYSNRGLKRFIEEIEKIVKKSGYSINITDGDWASAEMYEFSGYFYGKKIDLETSYQKMEKALQNKFKDFYVRRSEELNKFRILIPTETYIELVNKFKK